jgi:predicted nucleotidyltransferase
MKPAMTLEANAHLDAATTAALRLFAERIGTKYDVAELMLFGSRARGDHARHSDADVAVLLRGSHQRLLPTKLAMADDAFDVLLETGVRIQPLPIWEDEWANPEQHANPALLKNIAREGLRL